MATKQFLMSGTADGPLQLATQFSSLLGDGNSAWSTTEEPRISLFSTPGTLSNFQVGVGAAPGVGTSWVFTIRKAASGQAMADTDLSVTIADTAVLSSLDTDEVVVAAGEQVSITSIPSEEYPALATAVYWTCQFTPDTSGETILLSNTGGGFLGNFTRYNTLIGGKLPDGTRFDGQTLFPTAGTLKKLYIELGVAPGVDTSRIFTIEKNGVDTGLTTTISNTDTTGNDTDPAHNVTVAAGDLVTIQSSVTGAPAGSQVKFGIVFLPDTPGEYIASATTDDVTSSAAVEYQHLNCGDSALNGTETEFHCLAQETLAKKVYVNLATAPGAGSSWIFTLREALGDTALTVTISNTDTSGNAAVDEAIAADALLDTSIDATAGALTSKIQIAYLFYNTPTGWLSGWTKRVKLTIDNTDIDGTLANFPVLVYLSTSSGINSEDISFVFDELTEDANRKKIAVTTDDGETELYVEIEKWDDANEKAWLWVKVPSISSSADTELYLYYDSAHADNDTYVGDTNDEVAENVWDANFKAVHHMADGVDNEHIYDSTGGDHDGTKGAAGAPAETATAKAGDAQHFDGGDDSIEVADHADLDFGTGDFSVEAWIKLDVTTNDIYMISSKGAGQTAGEGRYQWGIWTGDELRIAIAGQGAGETAAYVSTTTIDDTNWHFVAISCDRDGNALFAVDDNQNSVDMSGGSAWNVSSTSALRIGSRHDAGDHWFDGIIDEVRISSIIRPAAWLKATYETSRDHLLDWGSEEEAAAAGIPVHFMYYQRMRRA